MRVVFTGSPDEEKFYTTIAVSEELNELVDRENFADVKFYYFSSKNSDKKKVYENNLHFRKINLGSGFSPLAFVEVLLQLFTIFPDVVFSSGGRESMPVVGAAKLLGIPIVIHEANAVPDEVNEWAQDKAYTITIAYREVTKLFKEKNRDKTVHTGQPLRKVLMNPTREGVHELLNLEEDTPIIWVRGGKEGSLFMNQIIEESLPKLLEDHQVVHQTGKDSFEEIKLMSSASLSDNPKKYRYHIYDELDDLSTKMLAGIADIAITRAGVSLFELAHWRIPAIVVPKTDTYRNYEIKNAYAYARAGAGIVIEENNLNDSGLIFEIKRIVGDSAVRMEMKERAAAFSIDDASLKIAKEIGRIYLIHENEK